MQAPLRGARQESVPVHRVTQYFRGRLANKGTGEEGKGYGEEEWVATKGWLAGWRTGSLACAKGPASVRVVSQVAIAV